MTFKEQFDQSIQKRTNEVNWMILNDRTLISEIFIFIDTADISLKSILRRNKFYTYFVRKKVKTDDPRYIAVYCRVPKEKEREFAKYLEDLRRKMLICGHPDYERFSSSVLFSDRILSPGRKNQ